MIPGVANSHVYLFYKINHLSRDLPTCLCVYRLSALFLFPQAKARSWPLLFSIVPRAVSKSVHIVNCISEERILSGEKQ